jgi:hypothetical protein
MELLSIIVLYIIIVGLLAVGSWIQWADKVNYSKARLPVQEGFMSMNEWLPTDNALTGKQDCNAGGPAKYNKKPFESFDLLESLPGIDEPRVASGPTSKQCWELDYARSLEKAGSYAQRTNNYKHSYPDSCSGLNQDLVLNFYKPVMVEGAIQV